jgi:NADPH2:quinone reductase
VAKASGADVVLNYNDADLVSRIQDAAGGERAVDRVVEVAFARNVTLDAAVLRPGGAIASYFNSNDGSATAMVPYQSLSSMCISVHFVLVYSMGPAAHAAAAADTNAALEAGVLRPRIAGEYALAEIVAAHERVGLGGAGGKVLVTVP